jgi:hypothetical protein
MNKLQYDPLMADKWTYIWGSENYSSKKGYLQIIGIFDASPIFQWMWKSCVRGYNNFFFWLLLHARLNTRNLLKRKNMDLPDYNCVLFSRREEEDLMHLFFECLFSKWCWRLINIHWKTTLAPQDMIISSRRRFNSSIFREIIMITISTI